jgi:hypothetical protein
MTTKIYYSTKTAFDLSNKWHGVVAVAANDITIQGLRTAAELKKQKDFCYTVQVRIRDGLYPNAGKDIQSNADLPFARVVSDSSGINTPVYNVGELVYGYWDDNTPVIEGKDIFSYAYTPGLDKWGEKFKFPETVSSYFYNESGDFNWSATMQYLNQANKDLYKDIELNHVLPCPDDANDSTAATTAIKNLIKELEGFKSDVNNFAKTQILDKINDAQKAIDRASQFISGWISKIIKWLQEQIMKKINAAFAAASNALPLNARFPIRDGQNILIEALYCLFNKILDNLEDFIFNFLKSLVDQFITVPLCIIEKLLLSLLSQIVGLITSILSAISGLIGSVFGLITGVIDLIIDLLEIFSCEPTPPCPDVKEWNILEGGKSGGLSLDLDSLLGSIESTIDQFSNVANAIYNPDTGEIIGIGIDDFAFDIEGIFNDTVSSCSGAPILCGGPKISFFGGSGSGAKGNVIVALTGEILGVDITDSGSGYTSAPYVTIADDCGIGRGVVATSEIGEVTDSNGNTVTGVIAVNILEPGFGYPSFPDGSLGGDGRVWATPDQTIVVRNDGKYDTPYSPGENIELTNGDKITYPDGTTTIVQIDTGGTPITAGGTGGTPITAGGTGGTPITSGGNPVTSGGTGGTPVTAGGTPITAGGDPVTAGGTGGTPVTAGGTGGTPVSAGGDPVTSGGTGGTPVTAGRIPVTTGGTGTGGTITVTAPKIDKDDIRILRGFYPSNNSGQYPIFLTLSGVKIINRGGNYSPDDKILITPDNGAELSITFNSKGMIDTIKVLKSGNGFTTRPKIYIESETGFNAKIIPVLSVNRIGDDKEALNKKVSQNQIIKVVDCVGKFS